MDTSYPIQALQSQPKTKGLNSDFLIVVMFALVGLLLALCAIRFFPETGTMLGSFTLS
jgi:hypothetical protein